MYPDNTLQGMLIPNWWVEDSSSSYEKGRLIRVFIPHVEQIPTKLTCIGRVEDTDHNYCKFKAEPLCIKNPPEKDILPVAAAPLYEDEIRIALRAKRRFAIIICEGGYEIERKINPGKPRWQTAPMLLVAPYYGVDEKTGSRAGFSPQFVDRVKQCVYPQFIWDIIPAPSKTEESILKLDHLQPVGRHHDSIELTKYRLSDEALIALDEWFQWLLYGGTKGEGFLYLFKEEIASMK